MKKPDSFWFWVFGSEFLVLGFVSGFWFYVLEN